MSVTEPFSAPYFSARVASGHRHLLRIRAMPSIIIAITGFVDHVDRDLFNSLLVKPFSMKDLVNAIKSCT